MCANANAKADTYIHLYPYPIASITMDYLCYASHSNLTIQFINMVSKESHTGFVRITFIFL